ncbi:MULTISPECIES: efflux RND transporter periplasmic adaptor subunit [Pseudoxanthomonas]|jgi:RND family efflux transporter, MFP subunit|uniref:RND family efflux transporter MFP subunit n=1 Tax=Pseudoxanthomonas taiwanensis J19 TaxID=935569 RepID=A0A562DIB1_9GAMM|nr:MULTISPECIES: efflux RND transporter periplasmic adaptor subunit [Pseudoxanthomonas]TWH09382.1 RND family efflux transporter MFP subunit [Pseudoxanthomonas taiwanensis J19]
MKARILRQPVLAMALLAVLAGCGGEATEEAAQPPAVTAEAPRLQQVARSLRVSGPVAAYEEMQLGVELNGLRVTALNVDVGQQVRAGQVLLTLDHRTLDSELAQARASMQEAEAALALARANYSRAETLAARQLISASQLDELRALRIQAEAQLATARARRDAAQLQRDFAELRAPADGIVSRRMVQPGQVVAAGTELLRLIRDGRLEWRAELPERQLALVEVGNPVELAYQGSTISGRVRAVSPGVDAESRTGTLYVDLPEPGPLKAGVYLEGRIVTGSGQALMLPSEAVVQRDGHAYVFVLDDGQVVQRRRVRTGLAEAGRIEIVEGLEPGRQVVVKGAGFLGEGDRVRVVADTDTEAGAP